MRVEYMQATKVDLSDPGVVKGICVRGVVEVSGDGVHCSEFHENYAAVPWRFKIEGLSEEAQLHFTGEKPIFNNHYSNEVIQFFEFIEDGEIVIVGVPPETKCIIT